MRVTRGRFDVQSPARLSQISNNSASSNETRYDGVLESGIRDFGNYWASGISILKVFASHLDFLNLWIFKSSHAWIFELIGCLNLRIFKSLNPRILDSLNFRTLVSPNLRILESLKSSILRILDFLRLNFPESTGSADLWILVFRRECSKLFSGSERQSRVKHCPT